MSIVSPEITDAVSQNNVSVVAQSPAMAMGSLYQTAAHSMGIMFENAVNAQNQQNIIGQAATTQGVTQLYSTDTVADAIATSTQVSSEKIKNNFVNNNTAD